MCGSRVEPLLRKYFWVLDFLAAGLCAMFLARATSSLIESRYLSFAVPGPPMQASAGGYTPMRHKAIDDICKRNIFCATCPPLKCVDTPVATDATKKDTAAEPVKTSLALTLMAVMYAEPPLGWKWSMAIIRDNDSKTQGPFNLGAQVRDGVVVTAIEETRVYIDNAGKPEYLDLIDTAPAPAPTVAAAEAPAAPSGDPFAQEIERGIKKTGENSYEIQRGTMDSVLGNIALLSRSARIVPEIRDGRAAGFRLFSVRPDGPFAKIGLQNGDVISAINGLEMSSPEKALEVYARLKSANHLSLGLERNGQKVTKDYSIR